MATEDDTRIQQFHQLYELIGKQSLADVEKFVKQEGITPEEYYSLRERTPKEGLEFMRHDPLWYAALIDAPDIVKYLISLGFDPHGARLQQKPLHAACAWEFSSLFIRNKIGKFRTIEKPINADILEVVRLLVEDHKVEVNVVDRSNYDYTPLLYAAQADTPEVVKLLVKAGADINAKVREHGNTALHLAALSGSSEVCEYFLSLGLNVDETNSYLSTPLSFAFHDPTLSTFEALLDAGADVNMKGACGKSYLIHALKNKYVGALKLLCSHEARIQELDEYILHKNLIFKVECTQFEDDEYDILRYFVVEHGFSPIEYYSHLLIKDPRVSKLLVACGYTFSRYAFDFNLEDVRATVSDDIFNDLEKVIKDSRQIMKNPRTLQELSCFEIRSLFEYNIAESVKCLHLPSNLKDFLLMKHV